MSTISWNCWGLGNPRIVHALQRALHTEAPQLVFLMETKLSQEDMKYKKQELGYTQGLAVSSIGQSGDLALLWKPETKVAVQGFSRWHINAHITCAIIGVTWHFNWLLWAARHKQKGRNMVHLGITWPNKLVTLALYRALQWNLKPLRKIRQ